MRPTLYHSSLTQSRRRCESTVAIWLGTDSPNKGIDSSNKGTDGSNNGTDSSNKGTDSSNKGTDNSENSESGGISGWAWSTAYAA